MLSDIRLLSSAFFKDNPVRIPKKQAGSSIMPGKIRLEVIFSRDSLCRMGYVFKDLQA
ncbi:MAG: hypothetical protein JXA66_06105 [Oligoflexia bacterium]|nr:hypothetical protein [Oligoflexia bacterium]